MLIILHSSEFVFNKCISKLSRSADTLRTRSKLANTLGYNYICDPLSKNPALHTNIEFELEAILSVQVISQLNSDYYSNVSQGAWTVSC